MKVEVIVYNLLEPIGYCYDLKDAKHIIDILICRINRTELPREDNEILDRLASLIFQQLVFFFGDYGVAPWFGWIDQEFKDDVIKSIEEWIKFEEIEGN